MLLRFILFVDLLVVLIRKPSSLIVKTLCCRALHTIVVSKQQNGNLSQVQGAKIGDACEEDVRGSGLEAYTWTPGRLVRTTYG
jgi:hypothetical protein